MALSLLGCAQGIRDFLTEQSEAAAGFTLPMIAGHIPTICEEFARVIANDPQRRDLLQPADPFDATITGGTSDIAANLIAPNRLMLEFIHLCELRKNPDDLGTAFHYDSTPSRLKLKKPMDSMFIRFSNDGSVLYFRDIDGGLTNDIGAFTISGPFIPVIAEDSASTTLPFALHGSIQAFGAQYLLRQRANGKA